MKRTIVKLSVFAGVFLISLLVISAFMNMGNTDMTAEMAPATLPTVSVFSAETKINTLRGYTMEMETASMRESITPLSASRQLEAVIDTYGQQIESVSYEIRSIDGSRLIEDTELAGLAEHEGQIQLSVKVKDLIQAGEEYSLIFLVQLADGRQVRYYTRIVQAEYHLTEKLAFVREFHEATFDLETIKNVSRYLEPNAEGDNSSLALVNIHSSARQVAWNGLDVKKESEPEITVLEIAPQTASVLLSYMVSYPFNGRRVQAYVEEYYRVRYTADRMYLLDYERHTQQLLTEASNSFVNDKLSLGVVDPAVYMKESDGGTVFAFVQGGALYSYNAADSRLARLYSFYEPGQMDQRTLYPNHRFRILQVDETGNVIFLVCGYMNRGRHEGRCGVQVMHYSSSMNVMEELAFIPSQKAAGILYADVENLSYVNGKNDLYLMLEGSIYHIGLESGLVETVASGLSEDSYRTSANNSMVAWQKQGDKYGSSTLVLMNLNNGAHKEINAGDSNYIRPLGLMGEDLIYGVARKNDVSQDSLGNTVFPMYRLCIQNENGNILKTYEDRDLYVTDCSIEENQIALTRVRKTEEGYVPAQNGQIFYSQEMEENKNYLETANTENLGAVVQIVLKSAVEPKKVKIQTPKEVLFEGNRDIFPAQENIPPRYYVYGRQGVEDILSDPARAVALAYENMGTVTAQDGSYIWKRDRLHTANQIMAITGKAIDEGETSLSVCLNSILQFNGIMRDSRHLLESGQDVMQILEESLENRKILDLKGCSLEMVLYYPDREIPVLAVMQDGSAVLIVGFNEQNVVLMDPALGQVYKKGMQDATDMFAENGNNFIAYW